MDNKIYYLTSNELPAIRKKLELLKGIWVTELDGKLIKDWEDYAHMIEKKMYFPTPCAKSFAVYADWMTDLDWLNSEGYALIIRNFPSFMSQDVEKKEIVIKTFENDILPWWQGEVEQCVVEGKAKFFNVYLVD